MFDIVRNNRRLVQLFLVLITLPFAFWGVESYVRNIGSGNDVASVGSSKISQSEFQRALNSQQERMRSTLGAGADPAMLDNPELRRVVLDGLISQRLMNLNAAKSHLSVSDSQLVELITSAASLQENGKFSPQRYEMMVTSQGMSKEMFEARVRQDLAAQQAALAVGEASLPGRAAAERWIGAQLEEREISQVILRPENFVAQVHLAPDAVKTYYETNRKQFETPEQVRAEFLMLSPDKLAAQVVPADDEVKAYYQSHGERYSRAEERRASHILISVGKDAPDAEDKAARAKAEDVLAQIRKAPGDFAKLATQYSQDTGSAARGGDLDWFGHGAMVPAFEQAVFALKENEVSGVVRSDFGYHIIKLTGVHAAQVKPFDQVRGEIVAELKRQAAAKKYAELAEGFTNTVYEQADSLKPAAEKYKLDLQTSPWLTKGAAAEAPFNNAKLIGALFADDAVKNKRNTEAVEVAPNTLAAARILEHKPAALLPLETVAATIEKVLLQQEAIKLAAKDGDEKLARLAKGEKVDLAWAPARFVTRADATGLAPDAVRAVFKSDVAHLPAFAGTAVPGGYVLVRITQVKPYVAASEESPRAKALREQYRRAIAEEEYAGWMTTLRTRFGVEIYSAALEVKEK